MLSSHQGELKEGKLVILMKKTFQGTVVTHDFYEFRDPNWVNKVLGARSGHRDSYFTHTCFFALPTV